MCIRDRVAFVFQIFVHFNLGRGAPRFRLCRAKMSKLFQSSHRPGALGICKRAFISHLSQNAANRSAFGSPSAYGAFLPSREIYYGSGNCPVHDWITWKFKQPGTCRHLCARGDFEVPTPCNHFVLQEVKLLLQRWHPFLALDPGYAWPRVQGCTAVLTLEW